MMIFVYVLGFRQRPHRPTRPFLMFKCLKKINLSSMTEIHLNTLFIRCRTHDKVIELKRDLFPLNDAEREHLKDVFIVLLPLRTQIETHYEKETDLTHQLTYCFIKP